MACSKFQKHVSTQFSPITQKRKTTLDATAARFTWIYWKITFLTGTTVWEENAKKRVYRTGNADAQNTHSKCGNRARPFYQEWQFRQEPLKTPRKPTNPTPRQKTIFIELATPTPQGQSLFWKCGNCAAICLPFEQPLRFAAVLADGARVRPLAAMDPLVLLQFGLFASSERASRLRTARFSAVDQHVLLQREPKMLKCPGQNQPTIRARTSGVN